MNFGRSRAQEMHDLHDLTRDPNFPFMAWRLQGATEMASHWMMLHEDPEVQEMGRRLGSVASLFVQSAGDPWKAPPVLPPATE